MGFQRRNASSAVGSGLFVLGAVAITAASIGAILIPTGVALAAKRVARTTRATLSHLSALPRLS